MLPAHQSQSANDQQASDHKGGDQRRLRSDVRGTALLYQLDQVVEDFGLEACLVADGSGKLVAVSSGVDPDFSSALAAVSAALVRGQPSMTHILPILKRHMPHLEQESLSVCEFRAQGKRLYVAAIGREAMMKEVGVLRAILGVRRIQGNTH